MTRNVLRESETESERVQPAMVGCAGYHIRAVKQEQTEELKEATA
jgi:hypothetical protein